MANRYEFDYSTDSFTDTDWENICDYVGLDVSSTEDVGSQKERSRDIGSDEEKSSDEEKRSDIGSDKEMESDIGSNEEKSRGKKIQKSGSKKDKRSNKKKGSLGSDEEKSSYNRREKSDIGSDKEMEESVLERKEVEECKDEESNPDFIGELRQDMKGLRKILKKGRVQLVNCSDENIAKIEETYKEFKHSSKMIKRKFKELLYGRKKEEKGNEGKNDTGINIPVDTHSKSVNIPVDARSKRVKIPVDAESESAESHSSRPIRASRRVKRQIFDKVTASTSAKRDSSEEITVRDTDSEEISFKHSSKTFHTRSSKKTKIYAAVNTDASKTASAATSSKSESTKICSRRSKRNLSKPIRYMFEGSPRYSCPSCDYVARSMGRAYTHMADEHNAGRFRCKKCPFTTKNPTSLHNHAKLYCPKKDSFF